MTHAAYNVEAFSQNLWRPSSLKLDGPATNSGFAWLSSAVAESTAEADYLEASQWKQLPPLAPSPIAGLSPETLPPSANPIAGALAASLRKSADQLNAKVADHTSQGHFAPISASTRESLKSANPIAYDRLMATSDQQQRGAMVAGASDDVTLLIPSSSPVPLAPGASGNSAPAWEEVFAARRRPDTGATTVSGLRLHDNEWYHFHSQIATPPSNSTGSANRAIAPVASTAFAPLRLLKSSDPASHTELGRERVAQAVQGITEGPWRPFLQGPTLKGSQHAVQGVHSSKSGFDAFKSTFDSISGVLKKIQDVAKGIMKVADFFGMAGQLGQFGDVLKWIGALNLPKSPADLINSLILGKGILPGSAPPAPIGICNGSGEGGLVVTQNGAAAEHLGKGMQLDVKILQKQGEGTAGPAAKDTSGAIGAKPNASGAKGDAGKEKAEQPKNEAGDDKSSIGKDDATEETPGSVDAGKRDESSPQSSNEESKPSEGNGDERRPSEGKPSEGKPNEGKPSNDQPEETSSEPENSEAQKSQPDQADPDKPKDTAAEKTPADSKLEGDSTPQNESESEQVDESDKSTSSVKPVIKGEAEIANTKSGPKVDAKASAGVKYEQKSEVADLSIVKVNEKQAITVEAGKSAAKGDTGKVAAEYGYGISNPLGDEIYVKATGEGAPDKLKVGVEAGIKGNLGDGDKVGVAAKISSDQPLLGGKVSKECTGDLATGGVQCTSSLEVSILRGTVKVSYEDNNANPPNTPKD